MKGITTFALFFILITSSFGQLMSHLTGLETLESGSILAEISLIHRSAANYRVISTEGAQSVIFSALHSGKEMKVDYKNFDTREGAHYEVDGITYVPIYLSYNNETPDPRDDIFIIGIPFPVDKELIVDHANVHKYKIYTTAVLEEKYLPEQPKKEGHKGNDSGIKQ